MESLLQLVGFIALAILVDTVWVALFRARPVGRFAVLRDGETQFSFTSNHGTFRIDRAAQVLVHEQGSRRGRIPFSEIKGIEYHVREGHAFVEELFFGFNATDLLAQYQDTVEWFSIAVVTSDGQRIPLYLSGQYSPREFFLGWYIELQAELLDRLGLLTDVEAQSRSALDLIQARLGVARLL
jgi:hypothetical protein